MERRNRLWRILLFLNLVVPLAGGIVLFAAPGFVPAMVGIPLAPGQRLLAYLIGGGEFAFALLCLLGLRSRSDNLRRTVALVAITFHGTAGIATLLAWAEGTDAAVLVNTAARVVMVMLFALLGLPPLAQRLTVRHPNWRR